MGVRRRLLSIRVDLLGNVALRGRQLAHGQVGAPIRSHEKHATLQRKTPGPSPSRYVGAFSTQSRNELVEALRAQPRKRGYPTRLRRRDHTSHIEIIPLRQEALASGALRLRDLGILRAFALELGQVTEVDPRGLGVLLGPVGDGLPEEVVGPGSYRLLASTSNRPLGVRARHGRKTPGEVGAAAGPIRGWRTCRMRKPRSPTHGLCTSPTAGTQVSAESALVSKASSSQSPSGQRPSERSSVGFQSRTTSSRASTVDSGPR